jgi:hypothetical protein
MSPAAPAGCRCATTGARKPNRLVSPHRPRGGLAGRRTRRPRAPGGRGIGPVEDPRRGAQAPRRVAGTRDWILKSSRNARVAALRKRWDRLRAALDLILPATGADVADIRGGASGILVRGYKGKKADLVVVRIDPRVVSAVAELRGHRAPHGRGTGPAEEQRRETGSGAGVFRSDIRQYR